MKVKDFVAFLQTLDQDADLMKGDYHYDSREGFVPLEVNLATNIVRPSESKYYAGRYPEDCYLMDLEYTP